MNKEQYFNSLPFDTVEIYTSRERLEQFFNLELSLDIGNEELTSSPSNVEEGILDYRDYYFIENEAPDFNFVSFFAYPQKLDDGTEIGIIFYERQWKEQERNSHE